MGFPSPRTASSSSRLSSIPRTWRWLNGLAQDGVVDFGINAMTAAVDSLRATGTDEALAAMLSPTIMGS